MFFYAPEIMVRSVVANFMPRVKPNSLEAMVDVLSKSHKQSVACKTHNVSHQSLSKNLRRFSDLAYALCKAREILLE